MINRYKENNSQWGEYSLVEHLKNVCSNNEKYKNLYAVWTLDKEAHSGALAAICYNFPHYSMHDESHSLSIINKIEMLLGEERIRSLSPTDTFLILESAYLHDIGMVVAQRELLKDWQIPQFKIFLRNLKENSCDEDLVEAIKYILEMPERENPFKDNDWPVKIKSYVTKISSEYYRRKHSIRSSDFIYNGDEIGLNSNYNKLIPNRIITLLRKIAVSHGSNFDDVFNELEHIDNGIGTDIVHPRFIASLLRLGDLLDLDDGRFNSTFEKIADFPDSSKVHKEKHKSITLFLVSPEKIQVSAICKDTKVYRETRAWFDWLKEEIKNLSSRWSCIVPKDFKGGPPSLGDIKLSIEGSENITEQLDLQFNISQQRAFELIEGQGIYSNKLVFIRELIQNAMDATKIQIWKDIKYGKYQGLENSLLNITEKELKDIKEKKNFEFPDDLPEMIKKQYPIHINIDYDKNTETLEFSIEDKGCGISIKDLKRMENVGGSWKQDDELSTFIDDMPEFLRPTGNFGLGLHSVFLVTNELNIETKSDDDKGYNINFVSRRKNGYITVNESSKKRYTGTKMSLKIEGESKIKNYIDYNVVNSKYISIYNKINRKYRKNNLDIFDNEYMTNIIKNEFISFIKSFIKNINILDIFLNDNRVLEKKNIGDKKNYKESNSEIDNYIGKKYPIDEYATLEIQDIPRLKIKVKDKKEGIVVYINKVKNFSFDGTGFEFKFKEIYCESKYPDRLCFNGYNVNIYKGEAKSILDVARENINIKKYESIVKRIEEDLMPEVMYILGDIVKSIDNSELKQIDLRKILFNYKKYTGNYLKFENKDYHDNIRIGSIRHSLKHKYVEITYGELMNLDEIMYISEEGIKLDRECYYITSEDMRTLSNTESALVNWILPDFSVTKVEYNKAKNYENSYIYNQEIVYLNREENTNKHILLSKLSDREIYFKRLLKQKKRVCISPIKCRDENESINKYDVLIVDNIPWNLEYVSLFLREYGENYCIISPIYNMNKMLKLLKGIDSIIEFLKKERNFNELINWVAENSVLRDKYKLDDIKKEIEEAYTELIKEFIDVYNGNGEPEELSEVAVTE
ncbi:HD domain-containing protein [Paraclostridium sordellii]|uniref:HD domain-containing protein n=1 Tax=Paraclostridium sordellii TaxID=1505 RepID=UPI0005E4F62E|nr:ATP-binding protein [Paeniclostridium sordellii]CEO26397.1 ATPase [[Clostridium] sordellii] [Paeniclostridium sordellii]